MGGACHLEIDPTRGDLIAAGSVLHSSPIFRGGDRGLWRLEFDDGSILEARQFHADEGERRLTIRREPGVNRIDLTYNAPEAAVVVHVQGVADGVEIVGHGPAA